MLYTRKIESELQFWQYKILQKPSAINKLTSGMQKKINSYIPDKVHNVITTAIKQMVRAVLFGSAFTTSKPQINISLMHREALVKQKITAYKKTGATEGGITGAGGFLMSLADFPLLLGIKIKLLYDVAALYGYDVNDYRERLYILHIFQLAFSSQEESRKIFLKMQEWDLKAHELPTNINDFDWLTFQQQYRDYIDLAKLAQMLPFIGAAVGAIANYKLIDRLGKTATMAYRMRYFSQQSTLSGQEHNNLQPPK